MSPTMEDQELAAHIREKVEELNALLRDAAQRDLVVSLEPRSVAYMGGHLPVAVYAVEILKEL